MVDQLTEITEKKRPLLKLLSIVVDGATLAVLFDWLMEPVAIKLGFWSWGGDGSIPYFNYACWFIASLLLLYIFHQLNFEKRNKFALHLLMIQVMFFLILRTLL
jgi:putative membrane protein